jgi:hypothetical protein
VPLPAGAVACAPASDIFSAAFHDVGDDNISSMILTLFLLLSPANFKFQPVNFCVIYFKIDVIPVQSWNLTEQSLNIHY